MLNTRCLCHYNHVAAVVATTVTPCICAVTFNAVNVKFIIIIKYEIWVQKFELNFDFMTSSIKSQTVLLRTVMID